MSWHAMLEFEPPPLGCVVSRRDFSVAGGRGRRPLVAECCANLECRFVDTRFANRYDFFMLEVVKAWIDPAMTDLRTLHRRGRGAFMVAGATIRLSSKMKWRDPGRAQSAHEAPWLASARRPPRGHSVASRARAPLR